MVSISNSTLSSKASTSSLSIEIDSSRSIEDLDVRSPVGHVQVSVSSACITGVPSSPTASFTEPVIPLQPMILSSPSCISPTSVSNYLLLPIVPKATQEARDRDGECSPHCNGVYRSTKHRNYVVTNREESARDYRHSAKPHTNLLVVQPCSKFPVSVPFVPRWLLRCRRFHRPSRQVHRREHLPSWRLLQSSPLDRPLLRTPP